MCGKIGSVRGIAMQNRASRASSLLRWIESALGIPSFTRSALPSVQVHRRSGSEAPAPPAEAKCSDEEHVCLWAKLVVEHPSRVVRIYAGKRCPLTHGMLRWSDLQRCDTLRLTPDAVPSRAMMKYQTYLTARAAPRRGFLDSNWERSFDRCIRTRLVSQVQILCCTAFSNHCCEWLFVVLPAILV